MTVFQSIYITLALIGGFSFTISTFINAFISFIQRRKAKKKANDLKTAISTLDLSQFQTAINNNLIERNDNE